MLATTIHKSNTTPHHQRWSNNKHRPTQNHFRASRPATTTNAVAPQGLLSQSPIVCPAASAPNGKAPNKFVELHQTPTHYRCEAIQRIA